MSRSRSSSISSRLPARSRNYTDDRGKIFNVFIITYRAKICSTYACWVSIYIHISLKSIQRLFFIKQINSFDFFFLVDEIKVLRNKIKNLSNTIDNFIKSTNKK